MPDDNINELMNALFQYDRERPAIRHAGRQALIRLLPVAHSDSGQAGVIGRFLLGLYNGQAYPFNLVDLRRLDVALFEDCLAVLRLDYRPEFEVHQYIENGAAVWTELKARWGKRHD